MRSIHAIWGAANLATALPADAHGIGLAQRARQPEAI